MSRFNYINVREFHGDSGVSSGLVGRCSKKSCDLSSTAATKIYQVAAVIVAGFDNETLAKVFQHVTGTGRREVDSDTSTEKCHVHVYRWASPMILRCHMTWESEDLPWHHAIGNAKAFPQAFLWLKLFGRSTVLEVLVLSSDCVCNIPGFCGSSCVLASQEASFAGLWDDFVSLAPCKSANETLESKESFCHGLRLQYLGCNGWRIDELRVTALGVATWPLLKHSTHPAEGHWTLQLSWNDLRLLRQGLRLRGHLSHSAQTWRKTLQLILHETRWNDVLRWWWLIQVFWI